MFMAISPGPALVPGPAIAGGAGLGPAAQRDHGLHTLIVRSVVLETAGARSFVLEAPAELSDRYSYEPGQFLTFRVWIGGEPHLRCYSMSSAPGVDPLLTVTVKRVPGGIVSNWMIDTLAPGDEIEATLPAGVFGRGTEKGDVVAFAGGSGITPVMSIIKSVLANRSGSIRLFYANRDAGSVMFAQVLESLAARHEGNLEVVHHLDSALGLVRAEEIGAMAKAPSGAGYYLCGPAPFMELVETTLCASGVSPGAVHLERFNPATETPVGPAPPAASADVPTSVTIELAGRSDTATYRPGTTILQTARQLGLSPPFSCEAGSCATCMARLVEGKVDMYTNNALTSDEVADGWILTCQSVPTTSSVHVIYEL